MSENNRSYTHRIYELGVSPSNHRDMSSYTVHFFFVCEIVCVYVFVYNFVENYNLKLLIHTMATFMTNKKINYCAGWFFFVAVVVVGWLFVSCCWRRHCRLFFIILFCFLFLCCITDWMMLLLGFSLLLLLFSFLFLYFIIIIVIYSCCCFHFTNNQYLQNTHMQAFLYCLKRVLTENLEIRRPAEGLYAHI